MPEEIPEVLHTFLEFFDTVEHHPSEQLRILKELFAAQLAEHER